MRATRSLVVTAILSMLSGIAGAQGCPTSLAHLAGKLPQYDAPDLRQARAAVLGEDMKVAYKRMLDSGISPAQGASMSVQAAQQAEEQRQVAKQCIRQTSTNPEATIASLENGSYRSPNAGILDACAKGYVLMYYMAVGMKESAVAIACMARQ